MKDVWVIGAGQLGRMMKYAGTPLGINVHPVNVDDPNLAAPTPGDDAVVTAERELWPQTPSGMALQAHPNFRNSTVFGRTADRKTQKKLRGGRACSAPFVRLGTDRSHSACSRRGSG